jgi:hypothetical protein
MAEIDRIIAECVPKVGLESMAPPLKRPAAA